MSARFVILHHVAPAGEHWDLMLEHQGVLLTWRLPVQPDGPLKLPLPATRIGDHRIAYLDYEGPVSGNRGTVRQIDWGGLRLGKTQVRRISFETAGQRLAGRFVLQHRTGDDWTLRHDEP